MPARPEYVHIIVNPAAGRSLPLLQRVNDLFRPAGIYWQISVTHQIGDGTKLAQEAVDRGANVLAVFGGDGTIKDVAAAIVGTGVPLLILPGGTGNLMAQELNLPTGLGRACGLITGEEFQTKAVDVGKMGSHYFLHRIGCGFESDVVDDATREMKKQFGKWAYVFASVKALQNMPVAKYSITIDDREKIVGKGVACAVANAGTLGVGNLALSQSIGINDGKLDVIFVRTAHIEGILKLFQMITGITDESPQDPNPALDASHLINHWQVNKVFIESDPIQKIQADGDLVAETPQLIEVLPQSLQVVV